MLHDTYIAYVVPLALLFVRADGATTYWHGVSS